ncbi:hypothetical protein [Aurantiacibacter luteus]|uniref:Uncharacterized protein n=1 Tax=Aurantiacibacter luteus TaxID=1581420 RepID=A0A0G9MY60_9SPHN|nr:hypothetical protein [Aurantiacibacter luteus]KLE35656.1 hypothetical protein AAW00_04445 [Aurantiacibacter luteus]
MAKLSKPPIPLKMYKHFAVVTLTLTAGIAMFADSDNREAMAQQIDEHRDEQHLREFSAQRFRTRELIRRDLDGGGTFGDEGYGYGAPDVAAQVNGTGSRRRAAASRRVAIPGYSAEQVAAMSEEQYQSLVAALPPEQRAEAAASSGPTAAQMDAISRASARRAGAGGGGADAPV